MIELAPVLAPRHVANVRALAREGFFDGLSVYRAQDNWVVQWGDADETRSPRMAQKSLAAEFTVAVGVARGNDPDSGGGTDLYAVIGQAPRHLDRNITLVGRVVHGMELLSALPRGPAPMGFYERAEERTPIRRLRVAADVPAGERPLLEVMRTDSALFAELVESRRNRRDAWSVARAGHVDVCNVPIPVRRRTPAA